MFETWYALQTIGRREAATASKLESSSVESFLPLLKRRVVTKYQKYDNVEPLFPGYLFARFDISEWPLIRKAHGVKVVRVGERPARVDDWIIEGLRLRMNDLGYAEPIKRIYDDLEPGSLIVGCGETSWAGVTGVFLEGLSGGERVAVLMNIMGGERRVVLARAHVEPLGLHAAADGSN